MKCSTLAEKLSLAKNIYSFIVEVYVSLSTEITAALSGAYNAFCSQKTTLLHEIRAITEMARYYPNADFSCWKEEWLQFLCENEEDFQMICFQTLKNMDDLIPELLEDSNQTLANHGPLNDYTRQDAFLYISAPDGFFDSYLSQNKIRPGRQFITHNATGLNRFFKNFFVVKKSSANDYIPTVKFYRRALFSGDELKIGFSPFSPSPWFEEDPNPENDTLGIKYDAVSYSAHNRRITDLIELFDAHKADIVTFPELALNSTSLKYIQDFLLRTELKYVKLICTGSCWEQNRNEAYILSKDGTVLLKYQKKKTYQRYDKRKQVYISENLIGDPYVGFLDIPGMGRVSYNICYDYINDDVELLCSSVMRSHFIFVAAYSNDTNLMKERADANARLRAVTTILTNACSAAEDGQLVCCIVEPAAENKQLIAKEPLLFHKGDGCGDCKSCVKTGLISVKELAKPGFK